jgi:E3 ubiquitin-protein ligase RNF14
MLSTVLQDPEKLGASSGGKVDKVTDLRNELVSIREALRDAVPCPHCRTAISRVSGGKHMRCRNCGTGFCYDCGKPLDNHRRYCTLF